MNHTERTVILYKQSDNETFGLYIGEDFPFGIYIITIEANSPAAEVDIHAGDRIISVNGQLVADMKTNPKEIITQIANNARSLTLTVKPSAILDFIGNTANNSVPSHQINGKTSENVPAIHQSFYYPSSPKQNHAIDHHLENYIKGLFDNENLKIVPSKSGNPYEFDLISDRDPSQMVVLNKNKYNEANKIQTSTEHSFKNNNETSYQQHPTSNMGISSLVLHNPVASLTTNQPNGPQKMDPFQPLQTIMPNSQNRIDEATNNNRVRFHGDGPVPVQNPSLTGLIPLLQPPQLLAPQGNQTNPIMPMQQPRPTELSRQVGPTGPNKPILPINPEGVRQLYLQRSPNANSFGFDVEFHGLYYLVTEVDCNSPAEHGGLHKNDVIIKIDNQPFEAIHHTNLENIMKQKTEVTLEVQELNAFLRTRPELRRQITDSSAMNESLNNDENEQGRKNILSRVLSKIKYH